MKHLSMLLAAILGITASACVSGSIPPRPANTDNEHLDAAVGGSGGGKPPPKADGGGGTGGHPGPEPDGPDGGKPTADGGGGGQPPPAVDGGGAGMIAPMPNSCPASTETDACFKCTDENCCDEYAACHDDPRCGMYYQSCIPNCLAGGKDYTTCTVECAATNGAGHAKFAPYHTCGLLHCLGRCGGDQDASPCKQCVYANCRDEAHACDANPDCDLLQACMTNCVDRPDHDACTAACNRSTNDAVKHKYSVLTTCGLEFCLQACTPDTGVPANPQTCADGAKTIVDCCVTNGESCDTQAAYERCCDGTDCLTDSVSAKWIRCMAGKDPTDGAACETALSECHMEAAR